MCTKVPHSTSLVLVKLAGVVKLKSILQSAKNIVNVDASLQIQNTTLMLESDQ